MTDAPDRPSVVLHGFHGGIVYSADIARRLADTIIGNSPETNNLETLPQVQDHGDHWHITGNELGGAPAYTIDISKRNAAVTLAGVDHPRDVLGTVATVEKFAGALAESRGGTDNDQSPFVVTDRGGSWFVRGSIGARGGGSIAGPFVLELRKSDGRVLDMYFEADMDAPSDL